MSIESLRQDIREIKSLFIKIKSYEKELRELRQHYKRCEGRIIDSLHHRQEPGAIFEGTIVSLQEVIKRPRISNTHKYEKAQEYIDTYGAPFSHSDMKEFLETLKGDADTQHKLKVVIN